MRLQYVEALRISFIYKQRCGSGLLGRLRARAGLKSAPGSSGTRAAMAAQVIIIKLNCRPPITHSAAEEVLPPPQPCRAAW